MMFFEMAQMRDGTITLWGRSGFGVDWLSKLMGRVFKWGFSF